MQETFYSNVTYKTSTLEEIHNRYCNFYKLHVDGECPFDDFVADVKQNDADYRLLIRIMSFMDAFNPNIKYPRTRIDHIEGNKFDRNDVFEFKAKKDRLRIYAIFIKPDVIVITGGYKTMQKKDIRKVFDMTNLIDISTLVQQQYN